MSWYAAHLVMFVELKNKVQERYPVWENIVLIDADSEVEAFAKAEEQGRAQAGDECGTFRWGNQEAQWVFEGVRKLTECSVLSEMPSDGDEVSFNELELASREAVRKFAQGKSVNVTYNDRFATKAPRRVNAVEEPKHRKKKGA